MSNDLKRIEKSRSLAYQFVKELPFVVGNESLAEARRHLWLAFGRGSPDLFKCSDQSIAYAIALSAMSGLYPGDMYPDVWLIPRKNRKTNTLECNWQMSARGYQTLAYRAKYRVRAFVVHHHDVFKLSQGTVSPSIIHDPETDTEGTWETVKCAYITVVDTEGHLEFAVLRKDQLQKRRDKAQRDNVWSEWPEEMIMKTMHAYAGARKMWPYGAAEGFAMAADQKVGQSLQAPETPALAPGDFEREPAAADAAYALPLPDATPLAATAELSEPEQMPIGVMSRAVRWPLERELKAAGVWDEVFAEYGRSDKWLTIEEPDIRGYLHPPDENLKLKEIE